MKKLNNFESFLAESAGKNVVFAFGRFNPPTIGHQLLVNKVATIAKLSGATPVIYVSGSNDNHRNPLDVATRIKYLTKMWPNITWLAGTGDANTLFKALTRINRKFNGDLTVVAGSDRLQEFQKIKSYNGLDYTFRNINIMSAGDRDPDDDGAAGMSGTKMRAAAFNNDFNTFRRGVPPQLKDSDALQLFNAVRKSLSIHEQMDTWLNEELLTEGINDKALFKAVILGGAPGSGKDYVMSKTLDGHGMKEVNSDKALEFLMDKHNLDKKMPSHEEGKRDKVRSKAKSMTELKQNLHLQGRNGLIINGTGDDPEKYKKIKEKLEELGYDTKFMFVNTTDEVSKARNLERGELGGRAVPENIRAQKYKQVQQAKEKLKKVFGDDNFIEFDNSEDLRYAPEQVRQAKAQEMLGIFKHIRNFTEKPPEKPQAKEWIDKESKRIGQPIEFKRTVPTKDEVAAKQKESGEQPVGHQGGAEERDSRAAKMARQMGLSYLGFGRYGKDGKATHKSSDDGNFLTRVVSEGLDGVFEEFVGQETKIKTLSSFLGE